MSYTVFLGNLPLWVTADDIKSWLAADNLVADNVKVIRNPETQESKGFAFIEAPNQEEMNSIIRRFDRAPLEERLLRANPAQPPKPKGAKTMMGPAPNAAPNGAAAPPPAATATTTTVAPATSTAATVAVAPAAQPRPDRDNRRGGVKNRTARRPQGPQSAFAEELAKAL
jgi:RNA recognition motif-containing protein